MNKLNLKYGLVALAGLGLSANVSAADFTCSDITFTPEAFEAYEFADKACLEIVDREGRTFAKFTATKVVPRGATVFLRFKHSDGTTGPRHKSNLPRDYLVMLDDQPVRLADMDEGQVVNIYIGSEFWTGPAAAAPTVVEEAAPAPAPTPVEEAAPVMVEEEVEEAVEPMLPTTAGPLPWMALFGSLFLLIGGALRLSRKL